MTGYFPNKWMIDKPGINKSYIEVPCNIAEFEGCWTIEDPEGCPVIPDVVPCWFITDSACCRFISGSNASTDPSD